MSENQAVNRKSTAIDLSDGIAVRTYLEAQRSQMKGVRSQWEAQYSQLAAFFCPRDQRWDPSEVNQGERQDFQIINETGMQSVGILTSGLQNGMSPQTRPWFRMVPAGIGEPDQEALVWCEQCADIVRGVMLRSNFYQALLELYRNEIVFGTGAFLIEADAKTVIRCRPYPNGTYWISCNDQLRVDVGLRESMWSARQLVAKFGYDNVSPAVQVSFNDPAGGVQDQLQYPVAHFILPGTFFGNVKGKPWNQAYMSVWYEISNQNEKMSLLRMAGFNENPLIVGRWRTVGENFYGESPCMDVLGSTMSLQSWEECTSEAAEKQVKPPLVSSTTVNGHKLTYLPGDIITVDSDKAIFRSAYDVKYDVNAGIEMMNRIESRIRDGLWVNVFMQFSNDDRKDQTATEVEAKKAEILQVVGPVVERNTDEVLAPSVHRIFAICHRAGKLPPLPASMRGPDGMIKMGVKLEFESILAQSERMLGLNNIKLVMDQAMSEVGVDQGILDNFDLDKVIRRVAKLAGMPNDLMNTPEQVAKIRADKAHAQQQAVAADQAQKLASAAQTASATPVGPGTLLSKVMPNLAGGQ